MGDVKAYSGGIPTRMDVEALSHGIGVPEEGAEIPHWRIEELIKCSWRTSRYRTVVSAWRASLVRMHGIFLASIPGRGYRALAPGQQVEEGNRRLGLGFRAIQRAAVMLSSADEKRLSPPQLAARDRSLALVARVTHERALAQRRFAGPKAVPAVGSTTKETHNERNRED
jgi:hypothetical protein